MGREVFTCLELEKPLAIHFCEDVSRYVITCTLLRFVECNLSNGKKRIFLFVPRTYTKEGQNSDYSNLLCSSE